MYQLRGIEIISDEEHETVEAAPGQQTQSWWKSGWNRTWCQNSTFNKIIKMFRAHKCKHKNIAAEMIEVLMTRGKDDIDIEGLIMILWHNLHIHVDLF